MYLHATRFGYGTTLFLTISLVSCSTPTVVPKRIGPPHPVVRLSKVDLMAPSEPHPLDVAQPTLKVDQPFTVRGTIASDAKSPRHGWLKIAIYTNDDLNKTLTLASLLISLADNRKEFDAPFEIGIMRPGKHRLSVEVVGFDGQPRTVGNGDLVIGSD